MENDTENKQILQRHSFLTSIPLLLSVIKLKQKPFVYLGWRRLVVGASVLADLHISQHSRFCIRWLHSLQIILGNLADNYCLSFCNSNKKYVTSDDPIGHGISDLLPIHWQDINFSRMTVLYDHQEQHCFRTKLLYQQSSLPRDYLEYSSRQFRFAFFKSNNKYLAPIHWQESHHLGTTLAFLFISQE